MSATKTSTAGRHDMEAIRKSTLETITHINHERVLEDMKRPTDRALPGSASAKDLPLQLILSAF